MDDNVSGIVGQMILDSHGNVKSVICFQIIFVFRQVVPFKATLLVPSLTGWFRILHICFNRGKCSIASQVQLNQYLIPVTSREFEFYLYFDKIQQLCIIQKKKFV